jgi:hypothetical protein
MPGEAFDPRQIVAEFYTFDEVRSDEAWERRFIFDELART